MDALRLNNSFQDQLSTEVAIIGAGVSGLYSAYRITSAKEEEKLPGSQVQMFELGNRIGGRLHSVKLPGMNITGELGGMRYMSSHVIVATLIEEIFKNKLKPIDFPMGDSGNLIAYLRKQRYKINAWEEAQKQGKQLKTRYFLNKKDKGFNADQLFNRIVYEVLMADPWFVTNYGNKISNPSKYEFTFSLNSRDWDEVKPKLIYNFKGPYNGKKLYEIGFWNLIKDRISQEGYNFLSDAGGYYSNTINWNAAEAFPYMVGDFSNAGSQYKTIEGGYDKIAYALADAYLTAEGSNIWIENKLITFGYSSPAKKYRYELTFIHLPTHTKWKVNANKIILAMPKRSLELLDQYNFFFDLNSSQKFQYNLESVIMEPSYKILMGFEYPWWKILGEKYGHSITDLPMRQCYYFGTDPSNGHSLMLGSYNDMTTVTFWDGISRHPDLFKAKQTSIALAHELDEYSVVQASDIMVNEVMHQLRELHGMKKILQPYITWFKDWTLDPFGAGYHAWKAGYLVKDVMEYMRKPMMTENIFICGEAYSALQGWVEGALCVAEKMLQDHFKMDRPEWLDKEYYLGW